MEETSYKGAILMMTQCDGDLAGFCKKISDEEGGNIKQFTGNPLTITSRQKASIVTVVEDDKNLYLVAHGNDEQWGSSKDIVTIDPNEVIALITNEWELKDVNIYLCICDSWQWGEKLKAEGNNLRVWAAEGTPCLTWNTISKKIEDSTGRFRQVL